MEGTFFHRSTRVPRIHLFTHHHHTGRERIIRNTILRRLRRANSFVLLTEIVNKREQLYNLAESLNPDIILGTESWLTPWGSKNGISNSEIFPNGYKLSVARRDRQEIPYYDHSSKIRAGGRFILLKDDIIGTRQIEFETNCEITWMKIEVAGSKAVYVAAYYRPHENDEHSLQELEKSLNLLKAKAETESHIRLGGDFNLPGYNWEENRTKDSCNNPDLTRRFVDMLDDYNLTQIVSEPTFLENTLDLFLTNIPSLSYSSKVIPGISLDGHHAVCIECQILPLRRSQKPRKIYLHHKGNCNGFRGHMKSVSNLLSRQKHHGLREILRSTLIN